MTDLGLTSPTAGIDTAGVDTNLRTIRAVEAGWRLPSLPDEVRMDLASNSSIGAEHISTFLNGIDLDYHNEAEGDPEPPPPSPIVVSSTIGGFSQQARSFYDDLRVGFADLAGEPEPKELAMDAVQRWKMRAIDEGYLETPLNGVVDGSWSPELNKIRRNMAFDQLDKEYRGDRPGAIPFSKAMETLAKWTSPSGLMRAAVDLDLWWDADQIGEEFSSWGDKWRKLGDSKNPLDFGKNLINALTGPIDDIVVPALNLALLFSGVGTATNFARLGMFAEKGLTGAKAIEGLYRIPVVGRFVGVADVAADFERLGQAGFLAGKLSNTKHLSQVGSAMTKWRQFTPVRGAKGVIREGMRLGVVSQAEHGLFGDLGTSLGDVAPGVRTSLDEFNKSPLVWGLGEALLTPYSIFDHGAFTGGVKDISRFAGKALGTGTGRAAIGATIGAAAGSAFGDDNGDVAMGALAGATAGVLPIKRFTPILAEQKITTAFHQGVLSHFAGDAEKLKAYEETFAQHGFNRAFAETFTGGDESAAGAMMSYVTLSASIDHTAAVQAGTRGSKGWQERYWLARNKLTAQVRHFDLDGDSTLDDVLMSVATSRATSKRGVHKEFELLKGATDPARAAEIAAAHNRQAAQTMRQLLSSENIPDLDANVIQGLSGWTGEVKGAREGIIAKYVEQAMPSFGNWNQFTAQTSELDNLMRAGALQNARYKPGKGWRDREMNIMAEYSKKDSEYQDDMLGAVQNHLFTDPSVSTEAWGRSGNFSPLATEIDPTRGRFTVARSETVTKQELLEAADELEGHVAALVAYQRIQRRSVPIRDEAGVVVGSRHLSEHVAEAGQIGRLDEARLRMIFEATALNSKKDRQAVRLLNEWAGKHGVEGLDSFDNVVTGMMDNLDRDARWADRFDIPNLMQDAEGKALTGVAAIKARAKSLKEKARYTAAEIDIDDLIAGDENLAALAEGLKADGYKLVHGSEYLMPHELLHNSGLFTDINQRHMNAVSLGNFFARKPPQALAANVARAQRLSIAQELAKVEGHGLDIGADGVLNPLSRDMNQLKRDLDSITESAREPMTARLADMENMSWIERRTTAFESSKTPTSIQDLGLGINEKRVVEGLTAMGWREDVARAAWRGVKKGRYADFNDLGLYALESKLRQRNQLTDALNVLGGMGWKGKATAATVGGAVGASEAEGDVMDRLQGAAIGGALAATGTAMAGSLGVRAVAEKFDRSKWARYGYMADNLARLRDQFRFTMSPFFDLSRYTESMMLNTTAMPRYNDAGEQVAMRLNQSPKLLKRRWAKEARATGLGAVDAKLAADQKFNGMMNSFKNAARSDFDVEALESTGQWFRSVGILGYDPLAWQTSTFAQLVDSGFSEANAWKHVKEMHTYGVTGRSAAEMSVNFVFFPFSFQKKMLTHAGQFVADDLSRATMVHDLYKTYEILDEKYDLGKFFEEKMPILNKLKQLNAFAYGISPGRLGGMNRAFIESGFNSMLNLFTPNGVSVRNAAEAADLEAVMKSTVPIVNDLRIMWDDAQEQKHVLFDPANITRRAQATAGYTEWTDWRKALGAALHDRGMDMGDLQRNPQLEQWKLADKAKKAELSAKYPGWVESKQRGIQRRIDFNEEKQIRIARALGDPADASPVDIEFAKFSQDVEDLMARFEPRGITEFDELPPEVLEQMRAIGVQMAERNPEWKLLWKKFFEDNLGPIEMELF